MAKEPAHALCRPGAARSADSHPAPPSALVPPPVLARPADPPGPVPVPVSATLAANEALADRRRHGQPVLPLAFGEAGLPVHPRLRAALAQASGRNAYGPVAGLPALRQAAAGYWQRRDMPTAPDAVICGPGSKPLIFALLMAIGADVAVARPSWVSYAAQAGLAGVRCHFVPAAPGEGGACDPARLRAALAAARSAGRQIGALVVTLPDNPTGRLASPATVRELCAVAQEHDLVIISDRDLPGSRARPGRDRAQPGAGRPAAHRGHDRAEQVPGPGRLADRGGQAARRPARAGPGRCGARHRQRDMVGACRPDPAGRGARFC